jgi:signal transduction histidine kinase
MTALRAPFTALAVRQVVFGVAGVVSAAAILAVPAIVPGVGVVVLWATGGMSDRPAPVVAPVFLVLLPLTVALLVVAAAPIGRAIGAVHRALAERLLDAHVEAPPPRRGKRVTDGPGWRAVGYGLLKVPLAIPEGYGAFCWVFGLVNLSYPVWWPLFRNHPAGTRLGPVWALTPFGPIGTRTFAGTFGIAAAGLAMLLVAPWLMRAGTALDLAAARRLLGPGRVAERVRELQVSRARAIDDAAAMMRRLERDLHDGAQIRLATLAMNLGMAREKLGDGDRVPDAAAARELVDAALRGAKDALVELRGLVRGIHPPVLDNGLADAFASLAADRAIPVEQQVSIPVRPTPAIETIAYFCAAELLANAAKHSFADKIVIRAAGQRDVLLFSVADDGRGGADPARGTGLSGLAQRVAVVDGRLTIASPPGGPTTITVELPLRA